MTQKALIILFVGLLVFIAHAFVALFKKTKIPDVLLLIIIGLILGPVLNIVKTDDFGKVGPIFSAIALIIILFEGGLELNIKHIKEIIKSTFILTILSFFITLLTVSCVSYFLLNYSLALSFYIGAVLAGPAPAIIIPLTKHINISDETKAKLTLESALGEALCIVFALAIIEFIIYPNIEFGKITGAIIASFVFAIIIGFSSGYLWSIVLNKVREMKNAIFLTPSFVFIIYGFTEFLGYSGPVAVLVFGITIGNAEQLPFKTLNKKITLNPITHNEIERLFFSEIVFLLKTFFFVYLGISIVFSDYWVLYISLILTIILALSRFIASRFSHKDGLSLLDAEFTFSMFAKGLATTVLASIPFQLGIKEGENIQNIVYIVILFSIILTSVVVFLIGKGYLRPFTKLFYKNYQ